MKNNYIKDVETFLRVSVSESSADEFINSPIISRNIDGNTMIQTMTCNTFFRGKVLEFGGRTGKPVDDLLYYILDDPDPTAWYNLITATFIIQAREAGVFADKTDSKG